ncbi:hypothetical protein IH992_30010, partial [Candidatus Poribacteria bacterium]|nr:hypothetical protein [Candidatus Poribacteria bacterium]
MNGISGFFKTSLIAVLAFGLMTAFSVSSFAANATWNGSVNQDWANVSNWDGPPVSAPGPGETATFDETKGSIGNGYPITNIPESTSNPVNVTVTNTGAAATVTLPSITIGTLLVTNNGQATNTLLQFSGPVKVKTAVTIQTTATANGGSAKLDLNGNTLSGVDSSVASLTISAADTAGGNTGDAELLDTGTLIVGAITVTSTGASTGETKLTSGSDITASGATLISASTDANGDATLTASGNFSGTSVAITSTGAGTPTLNIQTFDLTLTGAFTFTEAAAGNADPVFSSSNSTVNVGSLVINATTVSLSAITTGNIDILSATFAT